MVNNWNEHEHKYSLFLLTGYSDFPLPVFSVNTSLRTSRASSVSPHSIKNFGLSGKKNSQQPSNKLKISHEKYLKLEFNVTENEINIIIPWNGTNGHK